MITGIKSERIIVENEIRSGYVYFSDSSIIAVSEEKLPCDTEIDVGTQYVSAGFIDLHTHGGAGFDFIGSTEDIIGGSEFHLKHGTTSLCPTISAAPIGKMAQAVRSIAGAQRDSRTKANILGAHMEGPYLSKEQSGAQSPDFITPPDPKEYIPLIDELGHAIARWSYAPEQDEKGEFCHYLTEHGIIAAAGHTNAVYDEMRIAMENGCSLVTHLYSCTSTVTRDHGFRRLGVVETTLLCDDLYAEIIADGKHLPPNLIKLILKAKGSDKVALVTDSLSLAGTDITVGRMLNTDFIIEDGVCKLLDRSAFAGSIATADRLIRVMTQEVGISLPEAVKMMTKIPAQIMKVNKGILAPQKDADIIVFDDDIQLSHAWVMGKDVSEIFS